MIANRAKSPTVTDKMIGVMSFSSQPKADLA